MPPRLEAALLTLAAVATFWSAVGYAQHLVVNAQARLWVGTLVDGLICLIGLGITVALIKLALKRWREPDPMPQVYATATHIPTGEIHAHPSAPSRACTWPGKR